MNQVLRQVAVVAGMLLTMHIPVTSGEPAEDPRSSRVRSILVDAQRKVVRIASGGLRLRLAYDRRCEIDSLYVGPTLLSTAGAGYTGLLIGSSWYTTQRLVAAPEVSVRGDSVSIRKIRYAAGPDTVMEVWGLRLQGDDVVWTIERTLPRDLVLDDNAFPLLQVGRMGQYEGALLGNGGAPWFRLFNDSAIAYGVHTEEATFWSRRMGRCFQLRADRGTGSRALALSRIGSSLRCLLSVSPAPPVPRHDAGTHRRRFIRGTTEVWRPAVYPAGTYRQVLRLSAPDAKERLGRGEFKGIDGDALTALLNTTARLGVIDSRLFGANSWHTPYGPICLQEQYIALQGLGINDERYTQGYQECLDYYRDHAIQADGRVKPRWAYTDEDAIPGTADSLGFYEAQWGIMMDSQPDFVINVAEHFDVSGNLRWLLSHKQSCERALEYVLRRDTDRDFLVEMATESHRQARGSDWLDVIWASWENALVNAEVYRALTLWSDLELLLGDSAKAAYYTRFAAGLKESFNKPTGEGGFWDAQNHWFVHWREKDGSVFGNNLVTPVNFMAIGYGLCDDPERTMAILHRVEKEMQKEDLFIWPVSFFPYEPGAGHELNFPFPQYENGDLFLSWAELGVRAYADLFPEIALRYCRNILRRYEEDGLAFQRYLRRSQQGSGDDILAGNASAIVGLYRNIYGIQPRHNRLLLRPRLVRDLYGTRLRYLFREKAHHITFRGEETTVAVDRVTVSAPGDFGVLFDGSRTTWFDGTRSAPGLVVRTSETCSLSIREWADRRRWTVRMPAGKEGATYAIEGLQPHQDYRIARDGYWIETRRSSGSGGIEFADLPGDGEGHLFEVTRIGIPGHLREEPLATLARPVITPTDTITFIPGTIRVRMTHESPGTVIRYTTDGSGPTERSELYDGTLTLSASTVVKARAFRQGTGESAIASTTYTILPTGYSGIVSCGRMTYALHKGLHRPVLLRHSYQPRYAASGNKALTDGILGGASYGIHWQGFEKEDLEATIDLGKNVSIDSLFTGFLQDRGVWIFFPLDVQFSCSTDGTHFEPLGPLSWSDHGYEGGIVRRTYRYAGRSIGARYIRIIAKNQAICPQGHPGAGGKAWLFVDEVIIQ